MLKVVARRLYVVSWLIRCVVDRCLLFGVWCGCVLSFLLFVCCLLFVGCCVLFVDLRLLLVCCWLCFFLSAC